jgi:CBS domain-containing protein
MNEALQGRPLSRRTVAIPATVAEHMSAGPISVTASATLETLEAVLQRHRISGCPVVDHAGAPIGVVSRTDLLKAARPGEHTPRGQILALPDATVGDIMERNLVTVAPRDPLSRATRRMVRHRVHRVLVVDDGRLVGVLSTRDVMAALARARADVPIERLMSDNVMSIGAGESMRLAAERLEAAHRHALVVLDHGWPVGTLGVDEVLRAREWPGDVAVEEWMNLRVVCLPVRMALHRAAAHALAMRARHVLAMSDEGLAGVLTGIDFARAVR